jgi:hypothetical protein
MRITRGRHGSAQEGACVMELASMLAGERFTDRPECADPVIAAYLRALNDRLPHRVRQRLVPYAASVVGTRSSSQVSRRCRDLCLEFASGSTARPRLRLFSALGLTSSLRPHEGAADWAARRVIDGGDIDEGLALLDRLITEAGGIPPSSEAAPLPLAVRRVTQVG